MYKAVYRLGLKLPKHDKLGIHAVLETACLHSMALTVEAGFTRGVAKKPMLEKARIKIEIAKQVVRTEHELDILADAEYLALGNELVEISKMTTRWIQSFQKP